MSEARRYEILKGQYISVFEGKSIDDLENAQTLRNLGRAKSRAEGALLRLAESIGILESDFEKGKQKMTTPQVDIEFIFSRANLGESIGKQLRYTKADYADFATALLNIENVLKNAVLIEEHSDKYAETKREDRRLKSVYVLVAAFKIQENIFPIQMEIKRRTDTGGRLYVLVSMTKIKAGVLENGGNIQEKMLLPLSDTSYKYSLPQLFKNINPADKHFLKYVPDGFLSVEQKAAKAEALKEDELHIDDMRYEYAVENNNDVAVRRLLAKKQRATGYTPAEYGMVAKGVSRKIDAVTFDDEGRLIPLSKRFDASNSDMRYSIKVEDITESQEQNKKEPPSADARLMGEHTARMDEEARNSGKLPQGERISRDIAVPRKVGGKKTMRWIRTFFESDVGEPDMVDPVAEDVLAEGMSYRIVGDRQALKKAEDFIGKNGYEQALQDFYFNADRMEDGVKFNFARGKETVVQGQLLLRAAAERKDYHNFKKLVVLLAEIETLAGQTVQAASMLKKMSGETKLFEVKRMVDKLNKKLAEGKYGEKGKTVVISMEEGDTAGDRIVISPQLLDRLIAAGNDGDAANEAVVNIYKDIAKQLPASFLDKWNTWRYLAMLFNPTTHFRNLLSNAAFVVPMEIKNSLQWAVECGVGAFKKDLERTTTLGWDRAAMKFAREDALKMQLSLKGGGKYNEQDTIDQYRDRFKSRWFNWIDKGSRLNSGLLEMEDWVFLKNHYAIALARYITANKLDVDAMTPEQLEAARQQAINHAKKATFRDASKMANALSSASDKAPWANLLVESVMPFKKTPINILKRGVEYSPLGLISTIAYGSAQLKSGKISVGEYIAGLTAGLTGTGILALGFFLAKIGWLQGGFGRDDDDKENRAQDKLLRLQGVQEYSLTIGGVSYTLDWLAPTAIPLFMGVELYDALSDQSPNVWDKVWDAVIDGTDVIIETSMLNGLRGFVDGIKYDDNAILGIGGNSAVNYVSQAFPTVVGKLTGTIDGKRRINYVDKNSWVPEVLQDLGNKFLTKFWPWAKPVYYDEFGREKSNGNVFGRFVQNFFSPGYYSKIETGDLEEVIAELYATVEEPTPIPSTAAKYFKVDGETRYLKAEEYEVFSEKRGKMAYDIMHQAISSAEFEGLTAAQQATVLKEAYSYANAIAKTETVDCKLEEVTGEEWIYDAKAAQQALGLANILIYRQVANYDVTENKRINAIPMLRDAGLSEREAFTYAGDIRRGYRSGIDGTVYAASDIYLSITTGGNMYTEIYQDILDAYMRGGKSKKDANTAIKRGLSPHFKSAYLPASATEKSNIRRQMIMSGVYGTAQDVQDTLESWEKAED